MRAGYVRQVSAGIYAYLPLANRVLEKLKNIMREEFDEIGAVELLAPSLLTADLWRESGRYDTYGEDLYKLKNRDNSDFILGPTHEETMTSLVRDEITSYKKLPLNVYQIATKFRDEKRPRYGLLRGREFLMKDGYSYHADQDSLDETYLDYKKAYEKIFERAGLNFKPIIADAGAMGGKDSQEFIAITDDRINLEKWLVLSKNITSIDEIPESVLSEIQEELGKWLVAGEDTIVYAEGGDYAANIEMATSQFEPNVAYTEELELEKVATPGAKTIDEVSDFLEIDEEQTVKTLVYHADDELIVILLNGNDQLNEVKLTNHLGASFIEAASEAEVEEKFGAHFGSLGPIGLENVRIIADRKVELIKNAVVGANVDGYHYKNANFGRDFEVEEFVDLRTVNEGEISPDGRGTLKFARIYVEKTPREEFKFSWSINFPKELAPFDIHLVPVNVKDEAAMELTSELEEKLRGKGYQVLVDDRNERAGVKFADSDLIGLPVRVTIGKKAAEGIVEVKIRATGEVVEINKDELINTIEILSK